MLLKGILFEKRNFDSIQINTFFAAPAVVVAAAVVAAVVVAAVVVAVA